MKKATRRLIRGLVFLLAASLPRTSDAESVYGAWQGMMTQTTEEFVNGVESGPYTSEYPITLTMQWTGSQYGGSVDFNIQLYVGFYELPTSTDPFGPQSASFGGDLYAGGPGAFDQEFNLTASYSYIDPDGDIVGGIATADFSYEGGTDNFYISIFDSFQGTASVPEPSSIVTMGLGLVTALIFARRPGGPIRPFLAQTRRGEYR